MSERLRPILKWAGGKRSLAERILKELPAQIETYYEPFVGGAAVFLALAEQKRFGRAVITDKNRELINLYTVVRDDLVKLLKKLESMQELTREEEYYEIRAQKGGTKIERAARFIYLNKTGYNGLYRVNSKGGFNVPYGRYKRPKIYDPERLTIAAVALQGVTIEVRDFEEVCAEAKRGDAVYLDPPYLPLSKTASFSAYHSEAFGLPEHERLAKVFAKLSKRHVAAVLSNSATPDTRRLYQNFKCSDVYVRRPINSVASRRGAVSELLVVSK
ncbi:MAG: Methyl-directed repair adenine methylase [Polyangiaceae bacterium]|nr:Methyl-directed repair adenine methylase [Polyangiaceae bacterium]